jgi:amino acid transporter
LVLIAIINSTLANAIAGTNVFTRTAYAFGRAGAFPKSLAKLNERHRSPQNALIVQLVMGLLIGLLLGWKYGPTEAFGIVATGLVVIVVLVYAVTNLACIGYYSKHRKEERKFALHIGVPILGFLFLIPGFLNAAGITGIPGLKFIAALPKPLSYGAWAVGIWMLVGIAWLIKLRKSQPAAVEAVATVHE